MISSISPYNSYNPYQRVNPTHQHEQEQENIKSYHNEQATRAQEIQTQNAKISEQKAQENLQLERDEQNKQTRKSLDILA